MNVRLMKRQELERYGAGPAMERTGPWLRVQPLVSNGGVPESVT